MIRVHGRAYALPTQPSIVLCLDGSDPRYLDAALAAGVAPTLARWKQEGTWETAEAFVPTFTNPNNLSIVTGAPPSAHGICGNYYLDPATLEERPLSRADDVRGGDTILAALARRGVAVAAVTAKKKLLAMLTPPAPGVAFSAEDASPEAVALVGRAAPDVYSADCSLFVLDLGVALLREGRAQVVYASTTDYVQHKHAPGTPEANDFYRAIDERLAALEALGARIVLTADHGMNDKTRADGAPNVIYLEPVLPPGSRVVLPITDPYVKHHGALGGCAMVYAKDIPAAFAAVRALPGVERALGRSLAAERFSLPTDRIGDIVLLAKPDAVFGTSPEKHDLSSVTRGLRSHGGASERAVPLISNHVLPHQRSGLTNADAFMWALGAPSSTRSVGASSAPVPAPSRPSRPSTPDDVGDWMPLGFWARASALCVDQALVFIFAAFVSSALFDAGVNTGVGTILANLMGFGAPLVYTLVSYVALSSTPGKVLLFGAEIRTLSGAHPLDLRRSLLRVFGEIVTLLTFCLGYLLVAFRYDKRGLHDLIAGTRVVAPVRGGAAYFGGLVAGPVVLLSSVVAVGVGLTALDALAARDAQASITAARERGRGLGSSGDWRKCAATFVEGATECEGLASGARACRLEKLTHFEACARAPEALVARCRAASSRREIVKTVCDADLRACWTALDVALGSCKEGGSATAPVTISIDGPPGAAVAFDGRALGRVPVLHETTPGRHTVSVGGVRRELDLPAGQYVRYRLADGEIVRED